MNNKTFQLGAVTWTIKEDNARLDDLGLLGLCDYSKSLISLYNDEHTNDDAVEQTLYHEALHAMLNALGRHDLSEDEVLVQSLSLLIHQFVKTLK